MRQLECHEAIPSASCEPLAVKKAVCVMLFRESRATLLAPHGCQLSENLSTELEFRLHGIKDLFLAVRYSGHHDPPEWESFLWVRCE